ncbi:MAG: hypothetical protein A2W35_07660 [Chloroflexi bacterium RBG_16_57_11]|nr:MAG: hypothetical protein A2W35_07660 [Chloroflexi bacterium RBG_16_57_11]
MSGVSTTNEWSFRDEALAATHRWHLIVLFCLVGGLAGWLVSLVLPSPHRATKELFVGLNVFRSADDRNAVEHAGLPISSANDYKNWQMSSLNSVIFMDTVLDETLSRLRVVDPYWQNIGRQDLAEMLHVYWRNAGKWRLVAEHEDPVYAAQAVIAWQDVIVEKVHASVAHAQNAQLISDEWKAIADQAAQSKGQIAGLEQIRGELLAWRNDLFGRPADQVLIESDRLLLQQLFDQTGHANPWQASLAAFPPVGSPNEAYIGWIERALSLLDTQIQVSQARMDEMDRWQTDLAESYSDASDNSLGLSAELLVQKISDRKLEQITVRSTGVAILVGAAVGLILWALVWLVTPALRKNS